MANVHRGEVLATVNGQTFTLRFEANALAELEMALDIQIGGDPPDKNNPFAKGLFAGTRALLWAALLHDHPALTIHEVGTLLSPLTKKPEEFKELRRSLMRAYSNAWPEPKEDAEEATKNVPAANANLSPGSDSPNLPAE